MRTPLLLSVDAPNRVGLVASVTQGLSEIGGELLEAGQMVVGGTASLLLRVTVPDSIGLPLVVAHLEDRCRGFGITVTPRPVTGQADEFEDGSTSERLLLRITGHDQPGIIREISARFAREGIDIRELRATSEHDCCQITMELYAHNVSDERLTDLRTDLERWALDRRVDLDLYGDSDLPIELAAGS